jgi:hypothetical protein
MILRRVQYEMASRVLGPLLLSLEAWRREMCRRGRKPRTGNFGPPLECARKLRELMSLHYFKGRYADGAEDDITSSVTWSSHIT